MRIIMRYCGLLIFSLTFFISAYAIQVFNNTGIPIDIKLTTIWSSYTRDNIQQGDHITWEPTLPDKVNVHYEHAGHKGPWERTCQDGNYYPINYPDRGVGVIINNFDQTNNCSSF